MRRDEMTTLVLQSPLAGWALALSGVPDPVFSQGLAGDGLAIDPTGDTLHAPCDGYVVLLPKARHALTLRTLSGIDVLLHVGIDTVQMDGEGFTLLVGGGDEVRAGQALLRFDMDRVARRARSVVTPVVIAQGGRVRRRAPEGPVKVGDFLMEVGVDDAPVAQARPAGEAIRREFTVPFDHGFHARPAALIASALRPFTAEVTVVANGRRANARSSVALMMLGVARGDSIDARAAGADAAQALDALGALLAEAAPGPAPSAPPAPNAPPAHTMAPDSPHRLDGVIACRGVATGVAVPLRREILEVTPGSGDAKREQAALDAALEAVGAHLARLADGAHGAQREIFGAHVELIQDPELASLAQDAIRGGSGAGAAWRHASQSTIRALESLKDGRMRERADDLRDLEDQVLRVLAGKPPGEARALPERAILIADLLLPSQLAAFDPARIAGIVTARGGPTSHVAILAAALGIPALVAAGASVLAVREGTTLVLDAEHGRLLIDPDRETLERFGREATDRATQAAEDRAAASRPARTTDGVAIAVHANLGSAADAEAAVAQGAEGCGLLRTEFVFLERRLAPGEDEQAREYQRVADILGLRPLTIRTMDIGGDKPIAYLPMPDEDNPALGLRGVRASLREPRLLREQLRAILRVNSKGGCRILLPMVTDVEDVRAVRAMLEACRLELGLATRPALGVMIETPASAVLAGQLVEVADFLSLGTNDLSQYALAMDRGHPELAARLDGLHPAVLRLIAMAAQAGAASGKEVGVCGGLGADPAALPILIGLGIHEISAVPSAIPRIKRQVRALDAGTCRALAQRALEMPTAAAVRALVEAAAP